VRTAGPRHGVGTIDERPSCGVLPSFSLNDTRALNRGPHVTSASSRTAGAGAIRATTRPAGRAAHRCRRAGRRPGLGQRVDGRVAAAEVRVEQRQPEQLELRLPADKAPAASRPQAVRQVVGAGFREEFGHGSVHPRSEAPLPLIRPARAAKRGDGKAGGAVERGHPSSPYALGSDKVGRRGRVGKRAERTNGEVAPRSSWRHMIPSSRKCQWNGHLPRSLRVTAEDAADIAFHLRTSPPGSRRSLRSGA
jgi:hypothetical protein